MSRSNPHEFLVEFICTGAGTHKRTFLAWATAFNGEVLMRTRSDVLAVDDVQRLDTAEVELDLETAQVVGQGHGLNEPDSRHHFQIGRLCRRCRSSDGVRLREEVLAALINQAEAEDQRVIDLSILAKSLGARRVGH